MEIPRLFRLSSYLALTFATVALGVAEYYQIQALAVFYVCVGLLILATYLNGDRWLLPVGLSNFMGLVIFVGWVLWFYLGMEWESPDWISTLLPRAGPLLGVLLVAKLLRPKNVSDYWMLHLLGLVQVMLANVLALQSRADRENSIFGLLLLGYALSFIWAMTLFYVYREGIVGVQRRKAALAVRNGAVGPPPEEQAMGRTPWRTGGAASALGWFTLAMVIGLVIFFVVPRPGHDAAAALVVPGAGRALTGFSPGMDLNETSPIDVSDELVMRVEALDSEGRHITLDVDQQRWRGMTCTQYVGGRWQAFHMVGPQVAGTPPPETLEGNQLRLIFHVDLNKVRSVVRPGDDNRIPDALDRPGSQSLFLAEPIVGRATLPRVALRNRGERGLTHLTFRPLDFLLYAPPMRRSRTLVYEQLHSLDGKDDFESSPMIAIATHFPRAVQYWNIMLELPLNPADRQTLENLSRDVLVKANLAPNAAAEANLTPEARASLLARRAKALSTFLATSPDYGYSLERPRVDRSLDPTLDFLVNSKEGHCELFASALALMLRAQGIPSRIVIGFRGAEWNKAAEHHEILGYHAHAWVEAFIEQPMAISRAGRPMPVDPAQIQAEGLPRRGRWLVLDPTPAGGTAGAAAPLVRRGFWDDELHFAQFLWEFFILDYSGDMQRDRILAILNQTFNMADIKSFWSNWASIFTVRLRALLLAVEFVVILLVAAAILRRLLRFPRLLARRKPPGSGLYAELLACLARAGLRPRSGQTPAEFGASVSTSLRGQETTRLVADIPLEVVHAFYEVRYGNRPLPPQESLRLRSALNTLRGALQT